MALTQAYAKAKAQGSILVSFFLCLYLCLRLRCSSCKRNTDQLKTQTQGYLRHLGVFEKEAFGGFFITKRSLLATVFFC